MLSTVILVSVLINVILCQNHENWRPSQIQSETKNYEIIDKNQWRTNPTSLPRLKRSITDKSGAVSTRRTFVPSFRVILLEISLMAISVFLVNSLENYIKKPKNRPKNRHINKEELLRDLRNILRNFK